MPIQNALTGRSFHGETVLVTEEEIREAYQMVPEQLVAVIRRRWRISKTIMRSRSSTAGLTASRTEPSWARR